MDGKAGNFDECRGCVEILVLELADCAAVDRIGEIGAESRDVEVIDAPSHLLVGGEADADLAVCDLGMRQQILGGGHDLGHARLVVGAQQRRTVGVDERMPLEERQFREIGHAHRQLTVKHDARRGGHGTHHVAVRIHRHFRHFQRLHFVGQLAQQHQLLVGRGEGPALLRRLRVVGDVFQKSIFEFHILFVTNELLLFGLRTHRVPGHIADQGRIHRKPQPFGAVRRRPLPEVPVGAREFQHG